MAVSRVPETGEPMSHFGEDLEVLSQTAATLEHILTDFRAQLGRLTDKCHALETRDRCHETTINGQKKKALAVSNGVHRGAQQLQKGSPQSPADANTDDDNVEEAGTSKENPNLNSFLSAKNPTAEPNPNPNPLSANQSVLRAVADAVGGESYLFFATVSKAWLAAWNNSSRSSSSRSNISNDVMIMDMDGDGPNKKNKKKNSTTITPSSSSSSSSSNKQQRRAAPMTRAVTRDTTRSQLADCFASGLRKQPRICHSLAALGRLDLLRWARIHHGCPLDKTTSTRAALGGHLEVLAWAHSNGCPLTHNTCAAAAAGGHLDVLQWARANGCPWDASTCSVAALKGRLDVLRWALANRCPCDPEACAYAAEGGHLGFLQWARANGCPWDERTCTAAAGAGQLDVLRWARENGCPWDEGTCSAAAGGGHLGVLQWARENGCSWDEEACLTMLFEFGREGSS